MANTKIQYFCCSCDNLMIVLHVIPYTVCGSLLCILCVGCLLAGHILCIYTGVRGTLSLSYIMYICSLTPGPFEVRRRKGLVHIAHTCAGEPQKKVGDLNIIVHSSVYHPLDRSLWKRDWLPWRSRRMHAQCVPAPFSSAIQRARV